MNCHSFPQANINAQYGSIDFDCPAGGYIGGFKSEFNPTDRIWSVNCCTRQHATLVNCTVPSTLWENSLENVLNWTASSGRVLAGIQSFYSAFDRFTHLSLEVHNELFDFSNTEIEDGGSNNVKYKVLHKLLITQ